MEIEKALYMSKNEDFNFPQVQCRNYFPRIKCYCNIDVRSTFHYISLL